MNKAATRGLNVGLSVLACMGLLFLLQPTLKAQFIGYANYTFNGTTTCANENRGPDSIATVVNSADQMARSGELAGYSGPICTSTTGSNDVFNSKNWSTLSTYAAYKAIEGTTSATYIYWAVDMKAGLFFTGPDLLILFQGKKNGNGPVQGYVIARFGYKDNSNVWQWTSWTEGTSLNSWSGDHWSLTNATVHDFRFKWSVPSPSNTYTRVEFQLHGFNESLAGGQGDGFQIDDMVVLGADSPSPVQLVSFTSALNGRNVELKWRTATEVNNYGFEIQRSTDSKSWEPIGFMDGRGTVNSPQSYSYTDPVTPAMQKAGSLYYRLRQVDRDGGQEYSPVVLVKTDIAKGVNLIGNYPNPFNPSTTIAFSLDQKQRVSLAVYDLRGTEVARLIDDETLDAGFHSMVFSPGSLSSGTYLYTLSTPEGNFNSRMQITK